MRIEVKTNHRSDLKHFVLDTDNGIWYAHCIIRMLCGNIRSDLNIVFLLNFGRHSDNMACSNPAHVSTEKNKKMHVLTGSYKRLDLHLQASHQIPSPFKFQCEKK